MSTGNNESIDTIIDRVAVSKQYQDTLKDNETLEASFVSLTKQVNALNAATAASNATNFGKNSSASTATVKQMLDNQEKQRLGEIKLQQAREKAFDDYEKKLAKQQADADKAAAADAKRLAKQQADLNKAAAANAARVAKQQADNERATQKQISNQAKIDAANKKAQEPINQLRKAYTDSALETGNLAVTQGRLSQAYIDSNNKTKALKGELDSIKQAYGDNTGSVGKYENALNRLGNILTSRIFRTAATFIVLDIAEKGLEIIGKYIEKYSELSSTIQEFKTKQDAINAAFASSEYTAGISKIAELGANLKSALAGFEDKNKVVDLYNESLGKVYGNVDNITDAEKGFQANSNKYIAALLQQAAAQAILADTAKDVANTQEANYKLQVEIDANRKIAGLEANHRDPGGISGGTQYVTAATIEDDATRREQTNLALQKEIDKNNAALKARYDIREKIIIGAANQINKLTNGTGLLGDANAGGSASAGDKLTTDLANQALEKDKTIQQEIINNDQKSYKTRIAAIIKFGADEKAIAQNNYNLELKDKTLSNDQKKKAENDYANEVLTIQKNTAKQIQELKKQDNAESEKLIQQNLEAQKDKAKGVVDDPSSSLDQRLAAIEDYYNASAKLITQKQSEEVDEAGEDNKKKQIAMNEANNALLALTNETLKMQDDAYKTAYDQQLEDAKKHDKDVLGELAQLNTQKINKINDYYQKLSDAAKAQYTAGTLSEESYQAELKAIQQTAHIATLQAEIDYQKQLIKIKTAANPDADTAREQGVINKNTADIAKSIEQIQTENLKTESETRNSIRQLERDIAVSLLGDIEKVADSNYQNQIANLEAQSQQIDQTASAEKDQINSSLASSKEKAIQDKVIDDQAANQKLQLSNKEKKLKADEANFNKAVSAVNIGITAAESIAKIEAAIAVAEAEATIYLSNPLTAALYPGIAAIIAAQEVEVGLVAGLAAAQIGALYAIKTPAYRYGTRSAKGGLARVSEAGPELVQTPNGHTFLTPETESLINIPKGSTVVPNDKTMRMLMMPEKLSMFLNNKTDMETIEKLLAENNKLLKANKPVRERSPRSGSAAESNFERRMRR